MINGEWVPLAVKLDIPRDEFYSLNPKLLIRYMSFYEERVKRKRENLDLSAWANGLYVARAVAQLGKKPYPDSPLDLFGVDTLDQNMGDENIVKLGDGFRAWVFAFNQNFRKKKEREEKEKEVQEDGSGD